MWKSKVVAILWLLAFGSPALADSIWGSPAYVRTSNGAHVLSTPKSRGPLSVTLAPAEGKVLLGRLLDPSHMAVEGFGTTAGNSTLHIGDDTKVTLFSLLGPAKRLPDWRRCEYALGYRSSLPGDGTLLVVDMGDPCLDNPEYVAGILVSAGLPALSREYRRHLERFASSPGVHVGLSTLSGLRLGMSRAAVELVLGKPLWEEGNCLSYAAMGEIRLPPELLSTRWHWPKSVESKLGGEEHIVRIWFAKGQVSAFLVRKLYDF